MVPSWVAGQYVLQACDAMKTFLCELGLHDHQKLKLTGAVQAMETLGLPRSLALQPIGVRPDASRLICS